MIELHGAVLLTHLAALFFLEARGVGRDALFQRIGASVGFAFLLRREGLNYCHCDRGAAVMVRATVSC